MMNEVIVGQFNIFIWAFVLGFTLGILYDLLRIVRRVIPHSKIIIGIEDLSFWLVASIIIFGYVFGSNNGTIRGFIIIGLGIGVILYINLFSDMVVDKMSKSILSVIRTLKKTLLFIFKPITIILKPIKFLLKNIIKGLKKIKKCLIIRVRGICKQIKYIFSKV